MIAIWLPRRDEHELAMSLGMIDGDHAEMHNRLAVAKVAIARTMPQARLVVGRWHIWRVVREMVRLGVTNTPDGRAAAFGSLAMLAEAAAAEDGES